jgi:2-oxo-4-hydroxy-4-carboxy--5-ureidoimidazoline (OHCU) decarboxylase
MTVAALPLGREWNGLSLIAGTELQRPAAFPKRTKRYYKRVLLLPYLVAVQTRHMKEPELYWIEARTARLAALNAARVAQADFEDVKKVARFRLETP